MTDVELNAYIAGLFDGEGYVGITVANASHRLTVAITNTSDEIMNFLQSRYGGSVCKKQRVDGWKIAYEWYLRNENAYNFLLKIKQFSIIKKERIELAIEFYKDFIDLRKFAKRDYDTKNNERSRREDFREKMFELNKRGV